MNRPHLPAVVLYVVISLICTQIPLFNYLGFEFSFVVSLAGSLIAGLTAAVAIRKSLPPGGNVAIADVKQEFGKTLLWNLALLAIPALVMTVNALFVKNCSFPEGLAFFFLLPVISICFSVALAFFCAVHYRHPGFMFLLFFLVSLAYAAALGYWTPSIYSYNLFYGFFPGLTYDELLEISLTLIVFRAATIALGYLLYRISLIILTSGGVERPTRKKGTDLARALIRVENRKISIALVALVAGFVIFRAPLGLESPSGFIRNELGSSVSTPNFDIHYAASSYSTEEVRWLAADHEFRLQQITRILGRDVDDRISSFVYPTVESKRRYIGAGTTSIAKPWSGEIHLHAGGVSDVLKHELVHLAAAPYGLPLIHISISPGLTEGLAMALEWNWGNRSLHEYAAEMKRADLAPDMEPVMGSVGLLQQASSVSYVLAGSFCRFLIDRYGIRTLAEVYSWGNYETVFGKTLPVLLKEWDEMLATVPTDAGTRDAADVYFRAAPIFGKTCARVTARKMSEARRAFSARSYDQSAHLYGEAFDESRNNEALGGLLVSELRLGKTGRLIMLGDSLRRLASPGKLLPLYLPIGDALWIDGRTDEANQLYSRLLTANLGSLSAEAALVRLCATGDSLAPRFRSYFLSDLTDSLRIAILDSALALQPGHPLGLYLRGKSLIRLRRFTEALTDLDRADVAALHAKLEVRRRLARGDALFRLRRFSEARETYLGALAADPSPGLQEEVRDKAERCEWYEKNGMPDALFSVKDGEGR